MSIQKKPTVFHYTVKAYFPKSVFSGTFDFYYRYKFKKLFANLSCYKLCQVLLACHGLSESLNSFLQQTGSFLFSEYLNQSLIPEAEDETS